jgi:threonine dehydrogenase-like Zn-dependent dehydrogenase
MSPKSLWHIASNFSEIREESPSNDGSFIEVEALYSSISIGTEILVATGKVPLEMHDKMTVPYMEGSFNFPLKYGYSLVGKTRAQELVHVMHPHQSAIVVNPKSCFYFSDTINPIVATQFSNLETVVNALWTSEVTKEDTVLVCGSGSVGILLAKTLKDYVGAKVYVKEVNEEKVRKLRLLGFDIAEDFMNFDIAFNVSANENGLQYCIDHMVTEGKIIELSWYGTKKVELNLGTDFHYKRLQILSSQVSEIPKKYQGEFDFVSRKKRVEKIMLQVDFLPLITNIIPFEELPQFFSDIRINKPQNHFITIVKY